MVRDPETRRKLAILAIFLGIVFILGVLLSVLTGQSEWWTLILILPAGAIMRKLSGLAARPVRPRSSASATEGSPPDSAQSGREHREDAPSGDRRSEP